MSVWWNYKIYAKLTVTAIQEVCMRTCLRGIANAQGILPECFSSNISILVQPEDNEMQ